MHVPAFTTLFLGISSLGAMASPIANETQIDETLVRRSNSCTRHIDSTDTYFSWDVYLDNDAYYNKKCGNGCLDNFRKQCGDITSWGCSRYSNNRAHMTFHTNDFCTSYKITQALKSCTKGEQTINCV